MRDQVYMYNHHPTSSTLSSVYSPPSHWVRHRNFIDSINVSVVHAHQVFSDLDVVFKWQLI